METSLQGLRNLRRTSRGKKLGFFHLPCKSGHQDALLPCTWHTTDRTRSVCKNALTPCCISGLCFQLHGKHCFRLLSRPRCLWDPVPTHPAVCRTPLACLMRAQLHTGLRDYRPKKKRKEKIWGLTLHRTTTARKPPANSSHVRTRNESHQLGGTRNKRQSKIKIVPFLQLELCPKLPFPGVGWHKTWESIREKNKNGGRC